MEDPLEPWGCACMEVWTSTRAARFLSLARIALGSLGLMSGTLGQAERAERFLALHRAGAPLLLPNPWDAGSARLLASLGFEALATTSSGFAATLGRLDGSVSREEALAHAAELVAATELPVSADLEDGFAATPAEVAATVALAREAGLAGCSIEDYDGREAAIYDRGLAVERVAAAVEAAHAGPVRLVLTARAENHVRGIDDLADTIRDCRRSRRPAPTCSSLRG